MVCSQCGMRNLPDEEFCTRCGASLQAPDVAKTPPESAEASPEEARAAEVRACIEKGDIKRAMDLAREAVVEQPTAALSHILLGDVYLRIEANDDALREYRLAVESDSDNAEAREKAELTRRRIVEPREPRVGPARVIAIGPLQFRRELIPYIAGAAAALLVFCVGAAAIVSRTSPVAQRGRSFEEQMTLGSEHYRAGRYAEAVEAFAVAARLDPSNEQARRRLQDAQAMAGVVPSSISVPPGGSQQPRVAVLGPTTTPGLTAFPPAYVGPMPGAAPAQGTARGPSIPPPPPIPVPNPTGGDSRPELLPPLPPDDTVDVGAGPESTSTPGNIGAPAEKWGTEGAARDHETQPTEPRRPAREIVIESVPARTRTAPPQPRSAQAQDTPSPGEALRAEADQLRGRGRLAEAAGKYSEAAAQLRLEADKAGPEAATKRAAATSCERARQACESQLESVPAPPL